MQTLTLDEVRRELRKYIHSDNLANCYKFICNNLTINRVLEELLQNCPYLNPSRASYSPKVNFIWIQYFRNTREVLWLDMEEIRVNQLQERIQQLLEPDVYGNNICLEIYILSITNQNQLQEVIEFFKDKIHYAEQVKKENYEKILEKIWEIQIITKLWQIIKAFTKELVKPMILIPIIIFLYTGSYIYFINKLGFPFIYLKETSPDFFLKFILSLILIVITIYLVLPYSFLLSFFLMLLGLIIIIISYSSIKSKRFFYSLVLGTKNLFKFYFSLTVLIILFSLFWTPINAILNETKLPLLASKPLTELARKTFVASLVYQLSITDYPLLQKINGKIVLVFGIQKNLIYYYSKDDLIQTFQKNFYPMLKKKNQIKNFCKYIQKENPSQVNIIYSIFILPADKYNIYPLEGKQKDLLQITHIKDVKIENLNTTELKNLLNELFPFCNKTSSKSSQNKTFTKQET